MININKINININLNIKNLIITIIAIIFLIFMLFFISGCSSKLNNNKINQNLSDIKVVWSRKNGNMYSEKHDKGPLDSRDIPDLSLIKDVVPKYEPKSRYGNQPKYKVFNKTYKVLSSSKGFKARGYASWYGTKFHGFRTSSGEIYDMYKMTAAHKTLPLPTYLKVINLDNKRSIIVKVNDRGPFHGDRILDLSYVAASKLGIVNNGIGKVEIIAIDPVKNTNKLKTKIPAASSSGVSSRNSLNITPQSGGELNPERLNISETQKQDNQNNKYNINNEYLSKSSFQLGAFSVKKNAIKLINKVEVLLKKSNLLKGKHYEINIFEQDLKKTNKKNILYKVIINSKGNEINNKQIKNFLLNLPNSDLTIV